MSCQCAIFQRHKISQPLFPGLSGQNLSSQTQHFFTVQKITIQPVLKKQKAAQLNRTAFKHVFIGNLFTKFLLQKIPGLASQCESKKSLWGILPHKPRYWYSYQSQVRPF